MQIQKRILIKHLLRKSWNDQWMFRRDSRTVIEQGNNMIEAWYDGAIEPINPGGTGAYGFIVKKNQKTIGIGYKVIGSGPKMSNNIAEYSGLLAVLGWLKENSYEYQTIRIYSDSMLTVRQIKGEWKIKAGLYVPYALEARKRMNGFFPRADLQWIPREQNEEADALSKKALAEVGIVPAKR